VLGCEALADDGEGGMKEGRLGARMGWASGEEANVYEFAEKICECVWLPRKNE